MTSAELEQLVRDAQSGNGELDWLEIKSAKGGSPKVYDSLSSFSNRSGGGVILFGLDE